MKTLKTVLCATATSAAFLSFSLGAFAEEKIYDQNEVQKALISCNKRVETLETKVEELQKEKQRKDSYLIDYTRSEKVYSSCCSDPAMNDY